MKIMPPWWETLEDDASSINSSPIQELALAFHEHIRLQHPTKSPLQLYACFHLLSFVGPLNGHIADSWIRSLFTYFNICLDIYISRLLVYKWKVWLRHGRTLNPLGLSSLWICRPLPHHPLHLYTPGRHSIEALCQALCSRFYPPDY